MTKQERAELSKQADREARACYATLGVACPNSGQGHSLAWREGGWCGWCGAPPVAEEIQP